MPKNEDFLGKQQWNDLKSAIENDYKNVDVILVCSTLPFVFMSRTFTNIASHKVDDLEGMWSYKSEKEQSNLLNLL